jgi:hypothetical protein
MNSIAPFKKITTYQDLQEERSRLEALIKFQKMNVRQDLDALKLEAEEKFKPVSEAAHFVKKLASPATRNDTLIGIGTNITLELLIRRLFSRSNILIQLVVPTLLKNYSTHVLFNLMKKVAQRRQNGHYKVKPGTRLESVNEF